MALAAPWIGLYVLAFTASHWRLRALPWLLPLAALGLLAAQSEATPAWKLMCASLLFLFVMKGAVLASSGVRLPTAALLAFFTIWPGMNPDELVSRRPAREGTSRLFLQCLLTAYTGLAAIAILVWLAPALEPRLLGWLGIGALLLTIHFGLSGVITACMKLAGWDVRPLFDRPLASRSLRDFWTARWNRPFVDMDRRLFMPALSRLLPMRWAVLGVFLISGLLHEMAISYPAGGGWGGPLLYFLVQGVGVLFFKRLPHWATWLWILLPLPLLFHAAFRSVLIVPFFLWLHELTFSQPLSWYFEALLWMLGVAQLLVLMASFQVPFRLNWREECRRLSPFNGKLLWTLGGFTTMTITAFGVLTLVLHQSFVRGEPAAIGLAVYITLFWVTRLAVDAFFYKSSDWPEGEQFLVGHYLLNSLFAFLAVGYGSVIVYSVST